MVKLHLNPYYRIILPGQWHFIKNEMSNSSDITYYQWLKLQGGVCVFVSTEIYNSYGEAVSVPSHIEFDNEEDAMAFKLSYM
jgi:hypothetical protein